MAIRATDNKAARKLAVEAARLARDRNCEEILVLDLREISPVTDYFVIATGTSGRQLASVAEELADHGKKIGQKVWHVAGREAADWIVLDFVDVVVHLFNEQLRHYYDLELLWGEAPRLEWDAPLATPAKRRR
jgi:ribosome-associated protein